MNPLHAYDRAVLSCISGTACAHPLIYIHVGNQINMIDAYRDPTHIRRRAQTSTRALSTNDVDKRAVRTDKHGMSQGET